MQMELEVENWYSRVLRHGEFIGDIFVIFRPSAAAHFHDLCSFFHTCQTATAHEKVTSFQK